MFSKIFCKDRKKKILDFESRVLKFYGGNENFPFQGAVFSPCQSEQAPFGHLAEVTLLPFGRDA